MSRAACLGCDCCYPHRHPKHVCLLARPSSRLAHPPPSLLSHMPCRYTGTANALVCLALFLAASFSDPGTVTPANAAAHAALYPHDGLFYPEAKQCSTCRLPRPARSKHCRVCGRWVAGPVVRACAAVGAAGP